MEKLAICKECRSAFSFKPLGSFAATLGEAPVFCTSCGKEALVANGDFGGFFAAYHDAFPSAMSKKQKRAILDLAKKIVAGEIKESAAAAQTARDPETERAFSVAAKWFVGTVGVAGGLSSVAAVVIMLGDQPERRHRETMQRLDDIAEIARLQLEANEQSQKPQKRSKRSQSKSQPKVRPGADVPLANSGKNRSTKKRKKKGDPDVPLGGT